MTFIKDILASGLLFIHFHARGLYVSLAFILFKESTFNAKVVSIIYRVSEEYIILSKDLDKTRGVPFL